MKRNRILSINKAVLKLHSLSILPFKITKDYQSFKKNIQFRKHRLKRNKIENLVKIKIIYKIANLLQISITSKIKMITIAISQMRVILKIRQKYFQSSQFMLNKIFIK